MHTILFNCVRPVGHCVTLGHNFTGPYAAIGPNVTVYINVILEVKALSAGDLRWGSKNVPLPSLHHTLCIYFFVLCSFSHFLGNMSIFFGGGISIFLGEYIFLLILFTVLYQ